MPKIDRYKTSMTIDGAGDLGNVQRSPTRPPIWLPL